MKKNKKNLKFTPEQLLTNLNYGKRYTIEEYQSIFLFMVSNDKNGLRSIKRGISKNESILQLMVRLDKRRSSVATAALINFYDQKRVVQDDAIKKSPAKDEQDEKDAHSIQVVEKEVVRQILNQHLLNFLNEVISSGKNISTEFAELEDYHSGEKDWINNIWDEEISKKKRKFLLGKAQQLKDVIDTFQIGVHNLSFKFLLHLTSK